MDLLDKVIINWGFQKAEIIDKYDVSGSRIVYKINSDIGEVILKGIPIDTKEEIIIGNTKAHEYLGNHKRLAPRLIYLTDGRAYLKEESYYLFIMEFVSGRQLLETVEDEFLLGRATAKLHEVIDFHNLCSFNSAEQIKIFRGWFSERSFKKEFDYILDELPAFNDFDQCFIHTDIGPHNALLDNEGQVILVDLDDSGMGSRYIDLGWPFIMQFVDFNKKTHEMHYRFDLAIAFLKGYYGEKNLSKEEIDMIWNGAIYMHVSYMQCFGPDAVESLWEILKFGIEQKEKLYQTFIEDLS